MNQERILELANRANEDVGLTFKLEDAKQLHELMEKFAELIVQKCMNLVKDCYAESESGQSQYQTVCASTIIEDYFGVDQDSEEDSNETCPRCGEEWSGTSCGLPECGWVVGVEE